MEARERYRRDLAASVELGKQQSAEVIQRLQAESKQKDEKLEEAQLEIEKEKMEAEKEKMEAEKEKEELLKIIEELRKK